MTKRLIIALLLLAPAAGLAASHEQTGTTTPENVYRAESEIAITEALLADLTAAGGTVSVQAPVSGDVLAAAGTVLIEAPVAGDVRAIGGKVVVSEAVGGDVAVVAGTVTVRGGAGALHLMGDQVVVSAGADGPVTIYGSDISISGEFTGDVEVIASDSFTLGEDTHIHGALRYNAPQAAAIPASAAVDGGVVYTGSYAYVPTKEEAQKFALAGAGVFLVVRALAAMIAAGLLIGLFPAFANRVADTALTSGARRTGLYGLIGLALFMATPLLILLLLLSFVGAGIALLLGVLYLLLMLLAYLYAAVIAGAALRRHAFARNTENRAITWRDAVIGVIVLSLISIVPVVGSLVKFLLAVVAAGILATIAYRFASRAEAEAV